jgi:hypothetical protein
MASTTPHRSSSSSPVAEPAASSSSIAGDSGSSPISQVAGSTSSSKPVLTQLNHHHEDRLGRSWRALASCVIVAQQKAEAVVTALAEQRHKQQRSPQQQPEPQNAQLTKLRRDLDEAVIVFLKSRVEWNKTLLYLEAKLEGKSAEVDALQQFIRQQPSMYGSAHPTSQRRGLLQRRQQQYLAASSEEPLAKKARIETETDEPVSPEQPSAEILSLDQFEL